MSSGKIINCERPKITYNHRSVWVEWVQITATKLRMEHTRLTKNYVLFTNIEPKQCFTCNTNIARMSKLRDESKIYTKLQKQNFKTYYKEYIVYKLVLAYFSYLFK